MSHTHECWRCNESYDCDGELEQNYDGFPDPVCVVQKDPSLFLECEECRAGRFPCDVCAGKHRGEADDDGEVVCDECQSARSEAAHERMLEAYYGASTPQTITEQADAAARERAELRRHDK